MKLSGVYCIQCHRGYKYYGSSVNIRHRWRTHKSDLNLGKHASKKLQRAWDKYGEDNFIFSIVELVDPNKLIEREQFWIDTLFESGEYHYNNRPIAESNAGSKRSDESKKRMSVAAKNRKFSETRSQALKDAMTPERIKENALNQSGGKVYTFMDRFGNVFSDIYNLTEFAKEHDLDRAKVINLSRGRVKHHRGYVLVNVSVYPGYSNDSVKEITDRIQAYTTRIYTFSDALGNHFTTDNITQFAREHSLNPAHLFSIVAGKRKQHKGYFLVSVVEKDRVMQHTPVSV